MKHDRKSLLTLGREIRRLRKERHLSQNELADLAGLSRNFISMVERGERAVSVLTILDIADALRVAPAAMFAGYAAPMATQNGSESNQ
ncbi:helix-turn-helix domain-containing protein [Stakelama tenebrarum]|uniref:Helix-turn-helix transcriptional regulator n=1 Tax=Stakelama tenebrarum TaxID=2711215 RepID=A0A6G6Y3Z5_9SPHN|nr:helix-turn-helix transcriptional regulator [Sphingosinithalassobacter tenebrarum]QIG79635.1 helix-turn-helix transcriptional regulator [Sphingosinithalassobacter tenebrarum]